MRTAFTVNQVEISWKMKHIITPAKKSNTCILKKKKRNPNIFLVFGYVQDKTAP